MTSQKIKKRRRSEQLNSEAKIAKSKRYWTFVAYMGVVLLMGGGSRGDIQSLVFLRPIAVLVCGFAAFSLKWSTVKHHSVIFIIAACLFFIPLAALVPLPPAAWSSLPGHSLIAEIDNLAGLGSVWRPLSIYPPATWNALYSLCVPLAALLIVVQLRQEELSASLNVLIIFGLISGLIGLLQVLGSPNGPLYLYRVTNNGAAVGLFSNRNHQAIFLACMFPMLAAYASRPRQSSQSGRLRVMIAVAGALVLVPLLLVTGSRAGLAIGLVSLLSVLLLFRSPTAGRSSGTLAYHPAVVASATVVGVAALAVTTILVGRAEAFNRLVDASSADDSRFRFWSPIVDMAWHYWPFGSGAGTFAEAYKVDEPDRLLHTQYLNHAHNDWIEIFMTTGAVGILTLALVIGAWAWRSRRIWFGHDRRGDTSLARVASILVFLLALGSVSDYPLRVPFLACFVTILAVWMNGAQRLDDPANLGGIEPASLVQVENAGEERR